MDFYKLSLKDRVLKRGCFFFFAEFITLLVTLTQYTASVYFPKTENVSVSFPIYSMSIYLALSLSSHHAATHGSTAQAVVLGEPCTTHLQGEQVRHGGLPHQRVKERLQHLIRLNRKGAGVKIFKNGKRITTLKRGGKHLKQSCGHFSHLVDNKPKLILYLHCAFFTLLNSAVSLPSPVTL